MSDLISALTTNDSRTHNGALTNSTSSNPSVNLFFRIGALRGQPEEVIEEAFRQAYQHNKIDAVRMMFYSRDIRGGQGERRTFRVILNWLARHDILMVTKIIHLVPEYGRWDDLFCLLGTELETAALVTYANGLNSCNGLAAKWAPREGSAKHAIAVKLMTHMGWSPKRYRKAISAITKVVEQQMCAGQWNQITYPHVPSVAMKNYRKAFPKHDAVRWMEYLGAVKKGDVKINASALFPSDLVSQVRKYGATDESLDLQWAALPNYMADQDHRVLVMADVSGSMYRPVGPPSPMDVSIALAIYCAERSQGPFKGHFMSFTDVPKLERIQGSTLTQKVSSVAHHVGYGTNLQGAFDAILEAAQRQNLHSRDLPSIVLVISDMEFDNSQIRGTSNFEAIQKKYGDAGYRMPQIVFWNVASKSDSNFPVKFDQYGTALVSGYSPSILKAVLGNGLNHFSPDSIMRATLDSERYRGILA